MTSPTTTEPIDKGAALVLCCGRRWADVRGHRFDMHTHRSDCGPRFEPCECPQPALDDVKCPTCGGSGETNAPRDMYSEDAIPEWQGCTDCSGTGAVRRWWGETIERRTRLRRR
jgi:hypothetical protein